MNKGFYGVPKGEKTPNEDSILRAIYSEDLEVGNIAKHSTIGDKLYAQKNRGTNIFSFPDGNDKIISTVPSNLRNTPIWLDTTVALWFGNSHYNVIEYNPLDPDNPKVTSYSIGIAVDSAEYLGNGLIVGFSSANMLVYTFDFNTKQLTARNTSGTLPAGMQTTNYTTKNIKKYSADKFAIFYYSNTGKYRTIVGRVNGDYSITFGNYYEESYTASTNSYGGATLPSEQLVYLFQGGSSSLVIAKMSVNESTLDVSFIARYVYSTIPATYFNGYAISSNEIYVITLDGSNNLSMVKFNGTGFSLINLKDENNATIVSPGLYSNFSIRIYDSTYLQFVVGTSSLSFSYFLNRTSFTIVGTPRIISRASSLNSYGAYYYDSITNMYFGVHSNMGSTTLYGVYGKSIGIGKDAWSKYSAFDFSSLTVQDIKPINDQQTAIVVGGYFNILTKKNEHWVGSTAVNLNCTGAGLSRINESQVLLARRISDQTAKVSVISVNKDGTFSEGLVLTLSPTYTGNNFVILIPYNNRKYLFISGTKIYVLTVSDTIVTNDAVNSYSTIGLYGISNNYFHETYRLSEKEWLIGLVNNGTNYFSSVYLYKIILSDDLATVTIEPRGSVSAGNAIFRIRLGYNSLEVIDYESASSKMLIKNYKIYSNSVQLISQSKIYTMTDAISSTTSNSIQIAFWKNSTIICVMGNNASTGIVVLGFNYSPYSNGTISQQCFSGLISTMTIETFFSYTLTPFGDVIISNGSTSYTFVYDFGLNKGIVSQKGGKETIGKIVVSGGKVTLPATALPIVDKQKIGESLGSDFAKAEKLTFNPVEEIATLISENRLLVK
jgi:hypothetical protein